MADPEKWAAIERLAEQYREEYEELPELSVSELVARMETDNVILVDVRTDSEQAVSMLPGAIPIDDFEARKEEYRAAVVVTYCTVGRRSSKYAHVLRGEGFDVYNFQGSILAWAHAGRSLVECDGTQTRRVLVYGPNGKLLPQGYTPVRQSHP